MTVEFSADDVPGLCRLLASMHQRSDLKGSQLAIKTGIARSTVYSLIAPRRTAFPTKPEQVRSLAIACGLSSEEVDELMDSWDRLARSRRG